MRNYCCWKRRPPENELNALISFGNTILYNLVASLLYRSSLDIRIGFLHATTGTRAEALNLDIAEIFKPLLVDRVIFSLINKRTVTGDHFHRVSNNGVYLTSDGIQLFLSAFYEKLDTVITVGKDRKNYHQVLRDEIAALTRYFRNREPYKPFKQVR